MYQVVYASKAEKQLKKINEPYKSAIFKGISKLSKNPMLNANVKKLQGLEGLYRLRVGNYRIIYEITHKTVTILILEIGHRQTIY